MSLSVERRRVRRGVGPRSGPVALPDPVSMPFSVPVSASGVTLGLGLGARLGAGLGLGVTLGLGLSAGSMPTAAAEPRPPATVRLLPAAASSAAGLPSVAPPAVVLPAASTAGWRWPLQPRPVVLAGFVPVAGPYAPGRRGVDLLSVPGQPVVAAGPGTVVFSGFVAGIATVTVDHGAVSTTYQPVLPLARMGAVVVAGTLIGTVAVWPQVCKPLTCLRWGAYVDGSVPRRYLDPRSLLGSAPVRLLPATAGTLALPPPHLSAGPRAAGGPAAPSPTPDLSQDAATGRSTHSALSLSSPLPAAAAASASSAGVAEGSPAASVGRALEAASPSPGASGDGGTTRGTIAGSGSTIGRPGPSRAGGAKLSDPSAVPTGTPRRTGGDRAGVRRTIRQLGAVGFVATALGAAGLLLPAGESALNAARARRRLGSRSRLSGRRP